jgi:hypothetical protein
VTKTRRAGCLAFGIIWALAFIILAVGNSIGDCGEPDQAQCLAQKTRQERFIFWGGLAVLVIGGWLFYRREMKSDDL